MKDDGILYVTVYEGTGLGNEQPTRAGYQLNKKTKEYIEEIEEIFEDVELKGKLIMARG